MKEGQLYTANDKDFRVHFVKDGYVFGIVYNSENRYNFDPDLHEFSLRKCPADGLLEATDAELVKE